jgi:hypothetical protein
MSFSFEILSEGSLVSLFGNPRFLFFWTGLGFILLARSTIHSQIQSISFSRLWFDAR